MFKMLLLLIFIFNNDDRDVDDVDGNNCVSCHGGRGCSDGDDD